MQNISKFSSSYKFRPGCAIMKEKNTKYEVQIN